MRAFHPRHATKVLIALCLLVFSVTGYVEAGERGRHHNERPQHSRNHYKRLDVQTRTYNANRDRFDRRHARRDWHQHDRRDERRIVRHHRRHDRRQHRDGYWSNRGGDAYFGNLSAWRDGRNGLYFRSESYGYDVGTEEIGRSDQRPRGKIIHVNPSQADRSCSFEAGVCVIRR
ncbi:hypothetical protein [Pararhizobium antarcticum]|uniref:Uncharacterized protein n=1 Tax=Pararhizobium antarcticum TaxID=1798805 RepID=A0A657LNC9_9HYPH|nr:hypothetical protein [Pararhizobium antarcticum]OJF91871.1 hypothetical protein AX760_22760 [Pararhizobium antarcticum]OJF97949.1 hypothetical protein AX761_13180 [Rhizobium sp. 58]